MIAWWKRVSLEIGDALGGWLLTLPRDVALVLLALLVALLLLVARRLLTNQARLRLVRRDRRQLRRRIREARRQRDRPTLERLRSTRTAVARIRLRLELPALLVSLVPLALVMEWSGQRMSYLPPRPRETLRLEVRLPSVYADRVAHLVPQEHLRSNGGYVRRLSRLERSGPNEALRREDPSAASAAWEVAWEGPPSRAAWTVRLDDRSLEHPVWIGLPTYAPPRREHASDVSTWLRLRVYRPFGLPLPSRVAGVYGWQLVLLLLVVGLFYGGKHAAALA